MEEIKIVNEIREYDELIGAKTLHPLVNVVDFGRLPPIRNIAARRLFGYYAVYLKGSQTVPFHYGRGVYRYTQGSLVFLAPGQVAGVEDDGQAHRMNGHVLMFHPDLLRGTELAQAVKRYPYFGYEVSDALFPTGEEREVLVGIFSRIEEELRRQDAHSLPLVVDYIRLVLDYCARIYARQFSEAGRADGDVMARFEKLLDDFFSLSSADEIGALPIRDGVLTVAECAERLCLSTNYFNERVRQTTGLSALKLIHRRMLEAAKAWLALPHRRIGEVAFALGFRQSQNFSLWFKRMEGVTPQQYRRLIGRESE